MNIAKNVPFREPEKCTACSGSGWYDNMDKHGNPIPCGACDGTGLEHEDDRPLARDLF